MLTRPLIAFDIETVPDPDFGRRALGFEGDNAAVIEAMTTRRLEATDGKFQYPSPPLHRIVTIVAAELAPTPADSRSIRWAVRRGTRRLTSRASPGSFRTRRTRRASFHGTATA